VIVAPMAGVTDKPFRELCREYGARWLVSEMLTSDERLWSTRKSSLRMSFDDEPGPRWIQIAGGDAAMLASAAKANEAIGADIIDINMGCPAKKVCNKAAGSALLRDESLVRQILTAVVDAVSVPVTLKIRLGWSWDEVNAVQIAKIAEDTGVQLLTVHGRTRACRFQGQVNYEAIAAVKSAVSMPVIANGDIDTPQKAKWVIENTGCDGLMIGRAAQGKPWFPAQLDEYLQSGRLATEPSVEESRQAIVQHVVRLWEFYGQVGIARKHVGWYLDANVVGSGPLKKVFNQLATVDEQIVFLERLQVESGIAA